VLAIADGCVVGTALKVDGITWSRVDPARVRAFMSAARG
jgi:predicted TIM-barrel enzyme